MMRKVVVLFVVLSTVGIGPVRADSPTPQQKIDAIELNWLRTEQKNAHAYPQEPGVLVDPATGDVTDVLPNAPGSYEIDWDANANYLNMALIHLHPVMVRARGGWVIVNPQGLSLEDAFTAYELKLAFTDAVYIGYDGKFWRSRLDRMTGDGWAEMIEGWGYGMDWRGYALAHPEYVKYTLTRIGG